MPDLPGGQVAAALRGRPGVDVFRVPRQVDYVVSNLQVYVMICENCGFVRQHVRDLVDGTANPPSGGLFLPTD